MTHTPMIRRLIVPLLPLTLLLGGCEALDEKLENEEFRAAIPQAETVKIDVPEGRTGAALTVGADASLYKLTRAVSFSVNAHVGVTLGALHLVTLLPPSETGTDFRVWGPSEPKGLEQAAWKLTVSKNEDGSFGFSADARKKEDTSDDAFLPIVTGTTTRVLNLGVTKLSLEGMMTLNFDNSKTIGTDPCNEGLVHVSWNTKEGARDVGVQWENFKNNCDKDTFDDATYRFAQDAEGAGSFEFVNRSNIHENDPSKPELEVISVNSRWQKNGAGRSDVAITGGEVTTDLASAGLSDTAVKASQCWDDIFTLTWADTSPDALEAVVWKEVGEAESCAFTDASFPEPVVAEPAETAEPAEGDSTSE